MHRALSHGVWVRSRISPTGCRCADCRSRGSTRVASTSFCTNTCHIAAAAEGAAASAGSARRAHALAEHPASQRGDRRACLSPPVRSPMSYAVTTLTCATPVGWPTAHGATDCASSNGCWCSSSAVDRWCLGSCGLKTSVASSPSRLELLNTTSNAISVNAALRAYLRWRATVAMWCSAACRHLVARPLELGVTAARAQAERGRASAWIRSATRCVHPGAAMR